MRFLICILLITAGLATAAQQSEATAAQAPADLQLAEELAAKSDALGNYAWGVFLRLEGTAIKQAYGHYVAQALRLQPDSEALLAELVRPWLSRRDYAGAIAVLEPVAADCPRAVHIQLLLSILYRGADRPVDALRILDDAYWKNGLKDPLLVRDLASLYWRDKRYADIEKLLADARLQPTGKSFPMFFAEALYWYGMANSPEGATVTPQQEKLYRQRSLKLARKALARLTEVTDSGDCLNLAEILAGNQAWEQAASVLAAGAVKFPAEAWMLNLRQADFLNEAGKVENAQRIIRGLEVTFITNPSILAEAAQIALAAGEPEWAIDALDQAIKLAPTSGPLHRMHAYLSLHVGRAEEALGHLAAAGELDDRGRLLQAQALHRLGKYAEAVIALEDAIKLGRAKDDKNFFTPGFHLSAATLYDDAGLRSTALAQAEIALSLEPDSPLAANFVGYLLADMDLRLDEAERLVLQALDKDSHNEAYLDSLAWVYFRQGRFREALSTMYECIRYGGNAVDPVIFDHAGDIYHANGLELLANYCWWRALEGEPRNPDPIRAKRRALPAAASGLKPNNR